MKAVCLDPNNDRPTTKSSTGSLLPRVKVRRLVECSIITNLEDLDAIAEDWRRLAGDETAPFHTFGWNRAWFRHLAVKNKSIAPAVFVFSNEESIIGILPCYRLGAELRLAGDDECDYQDILVKDETLIPRMLSHVFKYLREEGCDLHFGCLVTSGKLLMPLRMTAQKHDLPQFSRRYGPCPWFELGNNAEEFLAKLKAKVRKRIRAALRRIEKQAPGYQCNFHQGTEITPVLIEQIAALHIRNQYRKQGKSIFEETTFRNFIAEIALRPDAGLRVVTLETDQGELIAFDLGFERGQRFSAYLGSFENEYSSSSPGTVLLYLQIEEWTKRGVEIYDFLCGNESYKYDYAEGEYRTACQRVFRKSALGRFRVTLLELEVKARKTIKSILTKLGLVRFFIN